MASHQRLALWDSENEPKWAAMPSAAGPDIHGPPPFRHPLACHNMALTNLFQLGQRVVGGGLVVLRQHLRGLSEGSGTRGSRGEACVRGSIGPTASVHLAAAKSGFRDAEAEPPTSFNPCPSQHLRPST